MGVLALVVLAISLAGHAAGSQALPTFFGLLLALSLTLALSSVATSRRRSFGWILGFVLALQVLLHFTVVVVGSMCIRDSDNHREVQQHLQGENEAEDPAE